MMFGKVFRVFVVLSVAATRTVMARDLSHGHSGVKGKPAVAAKTKTSDKKTPVEKKGPAVAASVQHAKPQAPIVMGRSVSLRHNTKLHHVKIQALDLADTPAAADTSR